MKRILENIEPCYVFRYFEDLTRIPRGSGNEDMVCEYLIKFAKDHEFTYYKDDMKNVLINVPAPPGYENHPVIILQAHTDMVCEKNEETIHDFTKDPIKIEIEGDKVIAKETTLGADDGMGIALAMALATDPEAAHPALEIVCTSDEERGMSGVEFFDASVLKGRTLINLDADDEGVFVVGCAGGPVIRTEIPVVWENVTDEFIPLQIKIAGLKGGHSGEDIHRGRGNSNILLNRILRRIESAMHYYISEVSGGLQYNAIPREAEATIFVPNKNLEEVLKIVNEMTAIFKNEYYLIEDDMKISVEKVVAVSRRVLSKESQKRFMNFITFSECGITRMNLQLDGVVESSVSVGVVRTEADKLIVMTMTRSSMKSMYMEMYYKIVKLAQEVKGKIQILNNCPEWEFNPKSEVKQLFEKTYEEIFDKKPKVTVLHAGLECGIFAKKIPEYVDMIAVGPDIRDLHTPGEYVFISSVQKFYKFFKEVFKRL